MKLTLTLKALSWPTLPEVMGKPTLSQLKRSRSRARLGNPSLPGQPCFGDRSLMDCLVTAQHGEIAESSSCLSGETADGCHPLRLQSKSMETRTADWVAANARLQCRGCAGNWE